MAAVATPIFPEFLISAQCRTISPQKWDTLHDLLQAIAKREPNNRQSLAMLRATASHVSMYLGQPPDRISIRSLLEARSGLRAYLKEKGLRRNSIRSYINYVRIFHQKAKELGWAEISLEVEGEWKEVLRVTSSVEGCSGVVRDAIRKGRVPKDFTETDLADWAEAALKHGRNFVYVRRVTFQFKKCVSEAGLSSLFPNLIPPVTDKFYGIHISDLPHMLRKQIEDLVTWKTAEFSLGRPTKARIRLSSAVHLTALFSQIFGFLLRVKGKEARNLSELLSQQSVSEFVEWCVNQRKVSGRTLASDLGRIQALKIYPPLVSHDFSWISGLAAQLPRCRGEQSMEKKGNRWVQYDILAKVPEQILQDVERVDLPENLKASTVRDSLLIRWLVTLPWRQRNIRECKVMPFSQGGNLSKEELPAHLPIARPKWVQEVFEANPRERFWQFYFRPHETKTGCEVRAILPRQLVGPLENYLGRHRSHLVRGGDPHTLFLNRNGRAYTSCSLGCLIGNLTIRHTGRRVNPHLFRDIFAVAWLHDHPEDYLTLSKVLWHRNIQTTLQIYGAGFDESQGTRRTEEWLDKRAPARSQGRSIREGDQQS